jgi:hypothetical protein
MLTAIGTRYRLHPLGRDVPSPCGLDHPTQPLSHFMSRDLDLVKMRRSWTLIKGLQLNRNRGRSFQRICQLGFQFRPFRIHARSSRTSRINGQPIPIAAVYHDFTQFSY